MKLISPAKLNLFFQVLRKRSDGFHDIASLYGAISLYDEMVLELASFDELTCNDPRVPLGADNLIMKAVEVFRMKYGSPFFVKIKLKKKIPMEAGLGGGSSNAATTLFGLNSLLGSPFDEEELMKMGAELGSDVPFFFSTRLALCTGRGDEIENSDQLLVPYELFVAKPPISLSTPEVYRATQINKLPKRSLGDVIRRFLLAEGDYFNDLESAAFSLQPRMAEWKEELKSMGFKTVVMTGSGSAFFCIGEVKRPQHEELTFYKVRFLIREPKKWWQR